ncbi:hypothetical protein LJ737_12560 [Hymenobacter sp. 15J16-1T3B]|uniref:hypothetical protein n=1 Tax=Hymenobacter sp. 15J16-1T3B TaxID=2886941 RepID=UPI001D0F832A|nr:hypothetical protein [Hymenobacter sp. 15J16-1T3B]MCC3158073.1 hypothetical protein [Hymenobacter sp. 15J16-1T3B]
MKKYLMLLSCAGVLTMASCSQDKSADTATTTETTTTTSTDAAGSGSAAMGGYSDADYNSRADRIAGDMATKMKLDEATRAKVRTAYYNRSKRLGELHNQYANDTTGMAAAMRSVYSDTDTELKSVFTDPAQYSTYESSRDEYMEDRYMTAPNSMSDGSSMSSDGSMSGDASTGTDGSMSSDMNSTTTTTTTEETSSAAAGTGMAVEKAKIKDAAGNKLKVKDNGKVKTKAGD